MVKNELYHHGVLGMKWGVRRYQNYDGTLIHPRKNTKKASNRGINKKVVYKNSDNSLTNEGIKKYYSTSDGKNYTITQEGEKFNKVGQDKVTGYKNSILYNVKRVDSDFNKDLQNYYKLMSEDNESYLKERKKWLKEEDYKGLDYYQFKEEAHKRAKDHLALEKAARDALEERVRNAAKDHPLFNKSFDKIDGFIYRKLIEDPVMIRKVNFGKEAVKEAMDDIDMYFYENLQKHW